MESNNRTSIFIVLAMILLLVSIVELMFLLNSETLNLSKTTEIILKGVFINFISSLVALIVFFFIFNDFHPIKQSTSKDSSITIYEHYRAINWGDYISNSREIEISVIYYDHHFNQYLEEYQTFFRNGGKLKLILPNTNNLGLINKYKEMFNEYEPNRLRFKIDETKKKIEAIYNNNHVANGSFEMKNTDQHISYFYYNCDNKKIFISIFEKNKDGIVKSPCILINNKNLSPRFDENYWKKEFNKYWI